MQDAALDLPTKTEIFGWYKVESIKEEIKYTLNLSFLDPKGNAYPMSCDNGHGKVVVKKEPFFVKLDFVKIEPEIEDPVWKSFWLSVKIISDVTIDKNDLPILTDDNLKKAELLNTDSPTILNADLLNKDSQTILIVVVVSLIKIIDNDSDDEYGTIIHARMRGSEITTSLMLHTVENDENIEYKAREIFYNNQDLDSDTNSNAKDIKEDTDDAEDMEDIEEDSDDAEDM